MKKINTIERLLNWKFGGQKATCLKVQSEQGLSNSLLTSPLTGSGLKFEQTPLVPTRHSEGDSPTESSFLNKAKAGLPRRFAPRNDEENRTPIHTPLYNGGKKVAFTLAEVLITLGIIGVVAALTLPALIQKQNVKTVETRLKKVYTVMNQAIVQSEIVNGPKEYWNFNDSQFIDKYISPYLNKAEIKTLNGSNYNYRAIYFADGSLLITKCSNYTDDDGNIIENYGMSEDWFFYPNAKNFDLNEFNSRSCVGKSCFAFRFAPNGNVHEQKKGFEPYKSALPSQFTEEDLRSNTYYCCNENTATPSFCTALIQYHGWKIPDDYPFKVK